VLIVARPNTAKVKKAISLLREEEREREREKERERKRREERRKIAQHFLST
jgi:hypothetical protein